MFFTPHQRAAQSSPAPLSDLITSVTRRWQFNSHDLTWPQSVRITTEKGPCTSNEHVHTYTHVHTLRSVGQVIRYHPAPSRPVAAAKPHIKPGVSYGCGENVYTQHTSLHFWLGVCYFGHGDLFTFSDRLNSVFSFTLGTPPLGNGCVLEASAREKLGVRACWSGQVTRPHTVWCLEQAPVLYKYTASQKGF